jgi:hypothetical protein
MVFVLRRTAMPRKSHKPEETYYRWRQEFGGLKSDQVKRLKELEAEDTRFAARCRT